MIKLSKSASELWAENEMISKGGGEGSRGGKIIGHTRHGKPIYESRTDEPRDHWHTPTQMIPRGGHGHWTQADYDNEQKILHDKENEKKEDLIDTKNLHYQKFLEYKNSGDNKMRDHHKKIADDLEEAEKFFD